MRKVGEKNMSSMPLLHRTRDYYTAGKQRVAVVCKNCEEIIWLSQGKLRHRQNYGFGNLCYSCYKKGKQEVEDAIKSLALRKAAAIKNSKVTKARR